MLLHMCRHIHVRVECRLQKHSCLGDGKGKAVQGLESQSTTALLLQETSPLMCRSRRRSTSHAVRGAAFLDVNFLSFALLSKRPSMGFSPTPQTEIHEAKLFEELPAHLQGQVASHLLRDILESTGLWQVGRRLFRSIL